MIDSRFSKRFDYWMLPPILTLLGVYLTYVSSHPVPADAGGFYLQITQEILAHDYALPRYIDHYTTRDIPFGYPPLLFYVIAFLRDVTGVHPLRLARYLPGAVLLFVSVATFCLGRTLLDTSRQAGLFAALVMSSPAVYYRHLSAGGLIRAPAFLLALLALVAGARLFQTEKRHWTFAALVLFAFIVLSHPMYMLFVIASYVAFWLVYGHTLRGVGLGLLVGVGGVVLASPWWWYLLWTHGADLILSVAGTRSKFHFVSSVNTFTVGWRRGLEPWRYVAILGILYAIARRRLLIPIWFAVILLVVGVPRFLMLSAGLGIGLLADDAFSVAHGNLPRMSSSPRAQSIVLLVLVLTVPGVAGIEYVGSNVADSEMNQFLTEDDVAAMMWFHDNSGRNASALVLGYRSEWFPFLTQRTAVVSPLGAEWHGKSVQRWHYRTQRRVSECKTADCLSAIMTETELEPDYVYVPERTLYGNTTDLVASLRTSSQYEIRYQNNSVWIFEVQWS